MTRNFRLVSTVAVLPLAFVFFVASAAEGAPKTAPEGEEQCIPQSVVDKVTTCPGGFKMGEFKAGAAKVGTSTVEKEVKKKGEVTGPSLDRAMVREITESAFKRKREKKKIDILLKEIDLIKKLVKQTGNDNPEKAEILKRLADAYKEYFDQLNFLARDLDDKIFQAKQKGDKNLMAKMIAQQKALDQKADEYRKESIKAYVEIKNNFPDYPDYDEILFAIAYEIDQMATALGQEQKDLKSTYRERARGFYQELIRNYPRSRFIPHSWMAFGEYYFHEARDVDRAMKAYEKVVEWGEDNNPNYVVAMYYQAWCLFNMQEYKKTINQFNLVIQYAVDNPEHREAQVVAKRARMEMVDSFSKIGNPAQAWDFFSKVGADQAHAMLKKLANLYFDEGQWVDTIVVFQKLQKLELDNYLKNNGDDLCDYQTMITNAIISSQPKEKQLQEVQRQIRLSKKFGSEGNHDKLKVQKCDADSITIAWDQATHWHLEAVGSESSPGTKDPATMKYTIALYDEVLSNYPALDDLAVEGFDENTKPTRYRVAYYKAELHWHMENWSEAAKAFDAVVEMDPQGVYTGDAAYAAVLAYNKVYVADRGADDKTRKHKLHTGDADEKCHDSCQICRQEKCGPLKGAAKKKCQKECESEKLVFRPRALTELEAGILKSYDRYVCFVTKDTGDMVNIKYRRARIYYEASMFAEAAVLFKDIATNHSDNEVAVYAANLYLDCLNVLGSMTEKPNPACYDSLSEIVDLFIDTGKLPGSNLMKDGDFAAQIKSLKVGVLRKKAESLTQRGRFKESAEIYLTIFREYKGVYDDRGMCEVLFNTAINMESARLVMSAIKVRQRMIELYPNCEHSKKAAFYIGQNYHALQSFKQAADHYRAFATKYSGEEEAPEALGNAVTFYIGLGETDEALKTVSIYEKQYAARRPVETASVIFGTGYIYINEENWEKVRKHYENYLKKYGKAKLLDEQVMANVFIGDTYWNAKNRDQAKAVKAYLKGIQLFEKEGLDKVPEPGRKAAMLIAVAKAKYQIAETKYFEFKKIGFPDFTVQRKVPDKIEKWWRTKQGPAELEKLDKWQKDRRRLARWGYWDESKSVKDQIKDVKKEELKEDANKQFEYWLEHEFKPWYEKKGETLKVANEAFGLITKLPITIPEWEMAAAARAGDMQYEFMQSLYDAPVPPAFKDDQELLDIYRQSMDEKAEPYREGAVGGFKHCLEVSTKLRWFNENSLRCERELNKLEPRQYPLSEEIRVMPKSELTFWTAPEAVLEVESEAQKRDRELASSADALGGKEAASE
jgi:TolA-binding protein